MWQLIGIIFDCYTLNDSIYIHFFVKKMLGRVLNS